MDDCARGNGSRAMDVILDSNQYLDDPRMEGARFQSLFDYLRRTGGLLVVPRVVRDEVLARYQQALDADHSRAVVALRNLRKKAFELQVPERPPNPDYSREVKRLDEKLSNPSPGVRSVVAENYSDINVEEVARRGIYRVKPANINGEELRDVMVWLATVVHAKRHGPNVGFISSDRGFQTKDCDLHGVLKDELAAAGIKMSFAISIEEFVTHADLPKKPISAEWAAQHLTPAQISDISEIFRALVAGFVQSPLVVLSASEPILQFKTGNLYELSSESAYAELEYEGTSVLNVSQTGNRIELVVSPVSSPAFTAGQVQELGFSTLDLRSWLKPAAVSAWREMLAPIIGTAASGVLASESVPFSAAFTVSLRIERDKVTKLEVYPVYFRAIAAPSPSRAG